MAPELIHRQEQRLLVGLTFLLLSAFSVFADPGLSLTASFQTVQGNYLFGTPASASYFYGGLVLQSERWTVSASIPVIFQKDELLTYAGGMYLPFGQAHHGENAGYSMHENGAGMMGLGGGRSLSAGLGDVYIYQSFRLLQSTPEMPSVSLTAQLKLPTAEKSHGFGTGEFDYGIGLNFKRPTRFIILSFDIGYLNIGDPDGIDYINPLFAGIGVTKMLGYGQHYIAAYVQGYSQIISGFEPPRQVSLGYTRFLTSRLSLSLTGFAGMSQTSPDMGFTAGTQLTL